MHARLEIDSEKVETNRYSV